MSEFVAADFSTMIAPWGRTLPTAQEAVALAQRAEACGFHSVGLAWLVTLAGSYESWADSFGEEAEGLTVGWSKIMEKYHNLESLVLLPMIAQATTTIKLGFNAFVPPALHPFHMAKYLATLDVATGGRVATAFGFGVVEDDGGSRMLEWLGSTVPANRRGAASEEALELITRLWTEKEPIDHQGKYFQGKQMLIEPKPVQAPYPEVWWAGERPRSLKMAARFGQFLEVQGEAIVWSGERPLDRIRQHYVPELAEANSQWNGSAKLAILLGARVTERPLTDAERTQMYWFKNRPDAPVQEVLPVGSPEQCAEVISALRGAGVDHFVLDFSHEGYESLNYATEQLEAWTTEVIPLLNTTT